MLSRKAACNISHLIPFDRHNQDRRKNHANHHRIHVMVVTTEGWYIRYEEGWSDKCLDVIKNYFSNDWRLARLWGEWMYPHSLRLVIYVDFISPITHTIYISVLLLHTSTSSEKDFTYSCSALILRMKIIISTSSSYQLVCLGIVCSIIDRFKEYESLWHVIVEGMYA